MSEQKQVSEAELAELRRTLKMVATATEVQRKSVASACVVTAGLVVGFIGFALTLQGEALSPAQTLAFLGYAFLLTPLSVVAVTSSSARAVYPALCTSVVTVLATGLGIVYGFWSGDPGLLGPGELYLLCAAVMTTHGLRMLTGLLDG
ncbi:MAG: hypothetical protein ACRDT8_17630 [Micromonosporaceae bacterium]